MRGDINKGRYDIMVFNDFSRFPRRNGGGLVELEDLRDKGLRLISISDGVDYPTIDDWIKIQIYFFVNEMPVTQGSKKVRNVIRMRQEKAEWICSVPYGYRMTNYKLMKYEIDAIAAPTIKRIFEMYISGYGYKKIARTLTEEGVMTPRSLEKQLALERGAEYKRKTSTTWALETIHGIIQNDFYIGTLRQRKYKRAKISGVDERKVRIIEELKRTIIYIQALYAVGIVVFPCLLIPIEALSITFTQDIFAVPTIIMG